MGCRVCGDARTVKSHIIPRAFARDVRKDAKHVIAGSPNRSGVQRMQTGAYSEALLCDAHENATAAPDKYAVEFVRRVQEAWGDRAARSMLTVSNPVPSILRSFALLTIWREVHFQAQPDVTLGGYDGPVQRHLFEGGPAPDWAIVVQRTNFTVPPGGASDFNLHPYQYRVADRSAWTFTVAGVCFIAFSDKRGLPPLFEEWRADTHNPCPVSVAEPLLMTGVGALQGVFASMRVRRARVPKW
jgi:hypothetical protein